MLLDHGLLLCLHVNKILKDFNSSPSEIISLLFVRNNGKDYSAEVEFFLSLLEENFWMFQKIDPYERTPERQVIPEMYWYEEKKSKFSGNLHKCFELNKRNFKEIYDWMYDVNGERKIN